MSTNYNRPTSKNNTSGNDRRIGKGSNSLHPLRKTSRSDEFFTDSIMSDGSKIPTPSPTKTENIPPSVKPRRAIGNSKNLKAAWDATANRERQFSHPSESATMRHIKPQQQAPARRSNPTPDLPEIKTRNSTPSPSRRAYGPGLTSPESTVSSPPKGLTEAYKRIADEEDLADQEGAFSDEAEFEQDMLPYDADKARSDRIRKSHSPVSIRSQRRNSPRPNGHGMPPPENKENVLQDETEMSKASDLSFINQLTDQELAAKLTPHALDRARDKARLQRAVQRDSPIAFSRAALGSKGHSADDVLLHESEEEADFTRSSNTSTGSGRSDRLDVSLNVPRNWGSKGRAGKEWLNRIHRKDKSAMEDSSAVDWTEAAADVPLPQNGDAALTQPDALRSSTPLSVNHKSSLDKLRQWELNDFTGTSLQISNSPPVRPRNPALGQIRDLEIENLERRAVTTNRLDELRKRESTEKLTRKISPSDRPKPEEPKSAKSVKFEDHGEAIPNTPIVIYKQGANGLPRSVSDNFGEKRSQTERTRDPREDLQRLARAISESPKGNPAEDVSIALKDLIWRRGADDDDESRNIEQVKATPLPSRLSALDLATKTPVVTGAWVDTILPDTIKTTKQTASDEKQLKTPHVLGGWVDTPLPSNKKVSESNEFPEDLMNGIGKVDVETKAETALVPTPNQTKLPQGPRSALAVLLAKAREKKTADAQDGQPLSLLDEKSIDLGDMTIESEEESRNSRDRFQLMMIVDSARLMVRRTTTSLLVRHVAVLVAVNLIQTPQPSPSHCHSTYHFHPTFVSFTLGPRNSSLPIHETLSITSLVPQLLDGLL